MPKPPIDPDSFDKVNFVIDTWVTGCRAPWYIYVETFKPAALTAFIALITFGWGDVLRGMLRPKGLGRRTSKRKGKWAKRVPAFPEVGNTIGKHLPFAEQVEDFAKWGNSSKFLWRIDTAMQHALFLWLVADIAEEFVFNWTSALYEGQWCNEPAPKGFSHRNDWATTKNGGTWRLIAYASSDYDDPYPSYGFQHGRTGPGGAILAASITWEQIDGYPAPTECKIRIVDRNTRELMEESSSKVPDADGKFRVPVVHRTHKDRQFDVLSYHNAPQARVGNGVCVGVSRQ